jgi:hypothetical protein
VELCDALVLTLRPPVAVTLPAPAGVVLAADAVPEKVKTTVKARAIDNTIEANFLIISLPFLKNAEPFSTLHKF